MSFQVEIDATAAAFWQQQAQRIDWHQAPTQTVQESVGARRWYVGGLTNLCHNALDRHVARIPSADALICVSAVTHLQKTLSFKQLYREVNRCAGMLQALGITRGERVMIYLPPIPEAVIALLACARLGAVHTTLPDNLTVEELARRIAMLEPKLIISADAGAADIPYKARIDAALSRFDDVLCPMLVIDRGLLPIARMSGRDFDYAQGRAAHMNDEWPCVWLDSNQASQLLCIDTAQGAPTLEQRDTGAYAVALAASMHHLFQAKAGERFFCTHALGSPLGLSYAVFAPLLAGMATVVYEGSPSTAEDLPWQQVLQQYEITAMLSSPAAFYGSEDAGFFTSSAGPLPSLRLLCLAGERCEPARLQRVSEGLGVQVVGCAERTPGLLIPEDAALDFPVTCMPLLQPSQLLR